MQGGALPAAFFTRDKRFLWGWLLLLLTSGFICRLGLALAAPSIYRTDEIFQTLEPAHRLVFGTGIVTWEWRDGIRSWLFPDFLAGLMALSAHFTTAPAGYLPLIAAALSLVSLGVTVTGTLIGWRLRGAAGAVLCGLLCCFWPDLIYFAPKALDEVVAGNILVVAAGLAMVWRKPASAGLAGILLGLVFCLRFQLSPALLVVAIWLARTELRLWVPMILGGLIPLAALGMSDAHSWGTPFHSILTNWYVNVSLNRAARYGVSPFYWYGLEEAEWWGAALLPLAVTFCAGIRSAPLMATVAIVVVLSHSLVGHKELSFIYAALPPALIVAGLGTVRLMRAARRTISIAAALWLCTMVLTGVADLKTRWVGVDHGLLALTRAASHQADLCGLALYGADFPWNSTGGYTVLDRPVPIYLLHSPADLAQAAGAFNDMLVDASLGATLPGYNKVQCAGDYCLLHRPQTCTPDPALAINQVLQRMPSQASVLPLR